MHGGAKRAPLLQETFAFGRLAILCHETVMKRRCIKRPGSTSRKRLASAFRGGFTLVEMAIVLMVMGVVLAVLTSLISSIPNLRSTETEAETLAGNFQRARNTALFTNSTFYLEFDLDKNSYRGYLMQRINGKVEENEKFDHSLAASNGLVGISVGLSGRVETGKVTVSFLPDGTAEQVAVFLGEPPLPSKTVILNRYGGNTEIHTGEQPLKLDKDWSENLESF